jgi:adenylate kinase family enzyme
MDTLFWRGNWQPVPKAEYLEDHRRLVAGDAWIIEGYIDGALAERARASELIIDLDYPGLLCMVRVLRRWWDHRRESRPELPAEARERLSLGFLRTVLTRAERPAIEAALVGIDPLRVRRVTSAGDLRKLLNEIQVLYGRAIPIARRPS